MSLDNNFTLPGLRDIFYQFELTEQTTKDYEKMKKDADAFIKEHFPDFDTRDYIDVLITGMNIEAQATGFEQGFEMALKLLGYSNTKGAGSPDV